MDQPAVTAPGTAQRCPALAGLATPPWLWVWLFCLLVTVPEVVGTVSSVAAEYSYLSSPGVSQVVGHGFFAVGLLSWIFGVLLYGMLFAGAVAVMFPALRCRWVERRFRLASDSRPVMAEMQRFVDAHDPSIRLQFSLQAGQMARIYPVGWRSARIAVFRPLAVLWHRDQEAAQAVLLHEVAHRRQGDQLIMGLGSPLVWLIRIGAPAYVLFVLTPAMVYIAAGGGTEASFTVGEAGTFAGSISYVIFLPVAALWLAELNADRQAVQEIGPGALQRALQATAGPRAPLAARAMAFLSYPPRRLRLRRATARPAGTVALMAAWPAAMAVFSLVLPFVIDAPGDLEYRFSPGMWEITFRETVHALLVQGFPLAIVTAAVLLTWPVLAAPWEQLWSPWPRPALRRPWWPSLATASLPAAMLLLSLAPLQPSPQEFAQASVPAARQGSCSQAAGWMLGGGLTKYDVSAQYYQLTLAEGDKAAMAADARRLDAAIRAALDNPPQGAARSSYIKAMIDYRTAAQELMDGNTLAASNEVLDATRSYVNAVTLLGASLNPSQLSTGCIREYSPEEYDRIIAQAESEMCADPTLASMLDCP
jgi:Zn-dependent protease with chaperone function